MKANGALVEEDNHQSSSSDSSSSNGEDLDTLTGGDLFTQCVKLPEFLLTYEEYNSIAVPQMKNFKVNTEKTSKSSAVKAREFFQNFDENEASIKCIAIAGVIACVIILCIIGAITYAFTEKWLCGCLGVER